MSVFPLFTRKDADEIISVLQKYISGKKTGEDIHTLVTVIDRVAKLCDGAWIENPKNILLPMETVGDIKNILRRSGHKKYTKQEIVLFIEKIEQVYKICKDIKISPEEILSRAG